VLNRSLDAGMGVLMKKLAVAAVALALIAAAPRDAWAQGSTAGAVVATVLGAAAGGAVGYYYVTGPVATVVGAVVGGFVGDWWYSAGTSRDMVMQGGKTKMFYTETLPPVQLIGYGSGLRQNLRTASFSAASD
jgi:MFS family permease